MKLLSTKRFTVSSEKNREKGAKNRLTIDSKQKEGAAAIALVRNYIRFEHSNIASDTQIKSNSILMTIDRHR